MLLQYCSNIFHYTIMYGLKYTNKRSLDGVQYVIFFNFFFIY